MSQRFTLPRRAVHRRIGLQMLVALAVWMSLTPALAATAVNPAAASLATDAGVHSKTTTKGDGYTIVEGSKAGARFAALRPDDWNGILVLLLHGNVPVSEPLQLRPASHEPLWSDTIDRLVSEGYGVAFSSYRVNGFAVYEGVIDTRVAQATFTASFGTPDATYLMGISMGTHVGQMLVETSPARYDGFLAGCSALGGATLQWEYFTNARILFDYYFPGVLPGNVWSRTDLDFFSEVVPAVVGAIMADPARAVELAGVDQLEISWTTGDELVTGILMSLAGAGGGTGDLQAKAGGIAIDNTETIYTGSSDDTALNAGIGRFAADRNAEQYLKRLDPDGSLHGTPVLALHSIDPSVQHEIHFPVYRDVLAAAGNEHLFETRLIDAFGHCAFTADEFVDAFQDLVTWAETGTAP